MKPAIVAIALLAFMPTTLRGQQPTPVAKVHKDPFHWLVEGTQELSGDNRVGVTTALAPDQRTSLIEAIFALLRPGKKIGDANSEKKLMELVANVRVKIVDLNGDGVPDVIAQASDDMFCSPTGNCTIWVFMRSNQGYRLILERNAVQTFAIRPTRTNGFNDLVLRQHGSAFESGLFFYRYINGQYRQQACYNASWERLVGDEWQELKKPVITPCE
jgi:hypothetical protein